MATEAIIFTSDDGVRLEGRLALPDGSPLGAAIICHPHPQYGGSMSSKLVPALQRALVGAGWAALRFNFRGVGKSEGSFGGGTGEMFDALGAIARVREIAPEPVAAIGWSFGALVGLNAVARDGSVSRFAGVSPPVRRALTGKLPLPPMADLDGWNARTLIVCGTEDPFCRPADAEELGRHLPPPVQIEVVQGADHFYSEQVDELCAVVAGFVTGE